MIIQLRPGLLVAVRTASINRTRSRDLLLSSTVPRSRYLPSTIAAVRWPLLLLFASLILAGCDSGGGTDASESGFDLNSCTIRTDLLADGGVPRDAIPALNDFAPEDDRLTKPGTETSSYLADSDRVIGLLFGDTPMAVPENTMWHHEIVNFDAWDGRTFAVTHCPLTGTSLAFDREAINGAELGVSGLLFNNNLVMFDRRENESLWPQMLRGATCGASIGTELEMLPVMEMTWGKWKELHPNTNVISSQTGFSRDYTENGYPYGNYDIKFNDRLLFEGTGIDDRRPPKERVLAIPNGDEGGIAFPFGELEEENSPARVVETTVGGREVVVFWRKDAQGAMAFRPSVNGEALSFSVNEQGRFVDNQGRTWTLDGRQVDGSTRLDPINTAYVSFWFAWAADTFHPETRIWTSGGAQ